MTTRCQSGFAKRGFGKWPSHEERYRNKLYVGYQVSAKNSGKQGAGFDQARLYDHPALTAFDFNLYHWALDHPDYSGGKAKRWEYDDLLVGVTTGDFWKICVR